MEELDRAIKEFTEVQGIPCTPEILARTKQSVLGDNSPGFATLEEKTIALKVEAAFWKGFKIGMLPQPERDKALGYKIYQTSPKPE